MGYRDAISMPAVSGLVGASGTLTLYSAAAALETATWTMHVLALRKQRIQGASGTATQNGVVGSFTNGTRGIALELLDIRFRFIGYDGTANRATAYIAWPQSRLCVLSVSFQAGANAMRAALNGVNVSTATPTGGLVAGTVWNIGSGGASLVAAMPAAGMVGVLGMMCGNVAQDDATVLATVQQFDRDLAAGRYLTPFAGATHYWDARDAQPTFYDTTPTWVDRISSVALTRPSVGNAELRHDFRARIF